MNKSIWLVQQGTDSRYILSILNFLLPEYVRIFGKRNMSCEPCIVYNDSQAPYPMLITNTAPVMIRLAQKSLLYWTQTIFQLSHELCHYVMRQAKPDKNFTLSWFEEIVCEAMSLYALQWSAEHWEECELYSVNAKFNHSINEYLSIQLQAIRNNAFQQCTSIEALKNYVADAERESHRNERNQLYGAIAKEPLACCCFCDYPQYVDSNHVTIDFETWEENDPNPMIRLLHSFQPCPRESSEENQHE